MSWERLAAEAAGVCRHVEEMGLCVACAARAIELAVDVMSTGRIDRPRRDGEMGDRSERTRRLERAIEVLGAQVVGEDAYDEAMRILRSEVPALVEEIEGWRVDVGRLSVANTELGLALVDARNTVKALQQQLERASRLVRAVENKAPPVDEICGTCDAFGACQSTDPCQPACERYTPGGVEAALATGAAA